jgi:preprotein translocase subunit SecD
MAAIVRRLRKAGLTGLFLLVAMAPGLPNSMAEAQPLRLDVQKAEAQFDARTSEPIVILWMTPRAGRMFYEFTSKNIGRTTEIRVDGHVVAAPVIREPILGGSVQVSGNFTVAAAKELAERLTKGAAKVEVEVVDEK